MAWRTVVISNPAKLKIENDQLVITQEESVCLSLEDIAVLMLESPEVILSSALLNRLAELDVTLLACDKRHLPSMAGLPFAGHSRLAGMQRMQLETGVPFRKRCWQVVIKQKIANQAKCLELQGKPGSKKIALLSERVTSGDSTNVESSAAREYFQRAFGKNFVRGDMDGKNSALDYGYAIMRGAVARSLAIHGFLLTQGIHHRSELNQFNLADDFIEPLRPLVDLCVAEIGAIDELTKAHREKLVSLLHADVLIDGNRQQALRAAEIMAGSFQSACSAKDSRLLKLPELIPITMHDYE